ncbi:MAG: hypothetical protein HUU15_18005 [Candidatus Brocadiae bacterium]|nr:hypothetical protein [Candidatus Brocadiia bacterium]
MRFAVCSALAVLLVAGCGREDPKPAAPGTTDTGKSQGSGSGGSPAGPTTDRGREPKKDPPVDPAPAKIVRKVTHPEKKGMLAIYRCQCQDKEWTQPAEEEKLCIEYCNGEMPTCGELVREEAAPK